MKHNYKKFTVVRRNELNEASYKLSLDEHRLILCAISRMNSQVSSDDDIEITAIYFADMWGVNKKLAYMQLKQARNRLYERSVRLKRLGNGEVWDVRWIESAAYQDGEGYVKLRFSSRIKQYLSNIEKNFTSYTLYEIRNFKSGHAIRLYELMMQYKSTTWRKDSLEELKRYFGVSHQYKEWYEFKRRVLDPAKSEINKYTQYIVDYDEVKRGRSVVAVDLTIIKRSLIANS